MNFEIDKSDQLYKYLQNIGVSEEQIEDEYKTFATSGLAKISDIKKQPELIEIKRLIIKTQRLCKTLKN